MRLWRIRSIVSLCYLLALRDALIGRTVGAKPHGSPPISPRRPDSAGFPSLEARQNGGGSSGAPQYNNGSLLNGLATINGTMQNVTFELQKLAPYDPLASCDIYGPLCQTGSIPVPFSLGKTIGTAMVPCSSYLSAQADFVCSGFSFAGISATQEQQSFMTSFIKNPQCTAYTGIGIPLGHEDQAPRSPLFTNCPSTMTSDPDSSLPCFRDLSFRPPGLEDFCCGVCKMAIPNIAVIYFPDRTDSKCTHRNQSSSPKLKPRIVGSRGMTQPAMLSTNVSTAVLNNYTFTSPSVYISVRGVLSVNNSCGPLGSTYTNAVIPVKIEDLSTVLFDLPRGHVMSDEDWAQSGETRPITLADLPCPTWGLADPATHVTVQGGLMSTSVEAGFVQSVGPPFNPIVRPPRELLSMDPAWQSACSGYQLTYGKSFVFGLFDPPISLTPAAALVAPVPARLPEITQAQQNQNSGPGPTLPPLPGNKPSPDLPQPTKPAPMPPSGAVKDPGSQGNGPGTTGQHPANDVPSEPRPPNIAPGPVVGHAAEPVVNDITNVPPSPAGPTMNHPQQNAPADSRNPPVIGDQRSPGSGGNSPVIQGSGGSSPEGHRYQPPSNIGHGGNSPSGGAPWNPTHPGSNSENSPIKQDPSNPANLEFVPSHTGDQTPGSSNPNNNPSNNPNNNPINNPNKDPNNIPNNDLNPNSNPSSNGNPNSNGNANDNGHPNGNGISNGNGNPNSDGNRNGNGHPNGNPNSNGNSNGDGNPSSNGNSNPKPNPNPLQAPKSPIPPPTISLAPSGKLHVGPSTINLAATPTFTLNSEIYTALNPSTLIMNGRTLTPGSPPLTLHAPRISTTPPGIYPIDYQPPSGVTDNGLTLLPASGFTAAAMGGHPGATNINENQTPSLGGASAKSADTSPTTTVATNSLASLSPFPQSNLNNIPGASPSDGSNPPSAAAGGSGGGGGYSSSPLNGIVPSSPSISAYQGAKGSGSGSGRVVGEYSAVYAAVVVFEVVVMEILRSG